MSRLPNLFIASAPPPLTPARRVVIQSLVKATTPNDYEHHFSVVSGLACVKRITDKVNETSREKENAATAKELKARVEDWKGHDPDSFGKLIIDDQLVATKGNTDREYHVFLFEQMLLCCKDVSTNALVPLDSFITSR